MRYVAIFVVALLLLTSGGFVWFAWHGAIAPIEPPARATFAPAAIARGAQAGGAGRLHVLPYRPGRHGRSRAGARCRHRSVQSTPATSRRIPRPASAPGPKPHSGAPCRQGVDRGGHQLYPAFPYDHFTLVSEADDADLYAYLMTREPVQATEPSNDLTFPLGFRFLIAGLEAAVLPSRRLPAGQRAERGMEPRRLPRARPRHCGACHTPRNLLGAEKSGRRFAGGDVAGLACRCADAASPAPEPWTADTIYAYLRHGWQARHGVALGPMAR